MAYISLLSQQNCNSSLYGREKCFLQRMPLQNYPETTQAFMIHLPARAYEFSSVDHRWHADYHRIGNQLIEYYDLYNCSMPDNVKGPLTAAQRDSDHQRIREELFKNLLDFAAKATEDSDPIASILFDGIGLILASDYLEAVHKVLSMFKTYNKATDSYNDACSHYSAGN